MSSDDAAALHPSQQQPELVSAATLTHRQDQDEDTTGQLEQAPQEQLQRPAWAAGPRLPTPSPPTLKLATITSLTVQWEPVEGATGYYVDYEPRSQVGTDASTAAAGTWQGAGGRAVARGTALIKGTTVRIPGLQKNADYVVRVTAVRAQHISNEDGSTLDIIQESAPSEASAFLRTLNPGAEIARLTATNAALTTENERIPVLERELADLESTRLAQVSALTSELDETNDKLDAANAEIVRLQAALAAKTAQQEATAAELASTKDVLADTQRQLASARAEIARLQGVVAAKNADVAERDEDIARLTTNIEERDAALAAAAREAASATLQLGERDAEIAALKHRVADLEGELQTVVCCGAPLPA